MLSLHKRMVALAVENKSIGRTREFGLLLRRIVWLRSASNDSTVSLNLKRTLDSNIVSCVLDGGSFRLDKLARAVLASSSDALSQRNTHLKRVARSSMPCLPIMVVRTTGTKIPSLIPALRSASQPAHSRSISCTVEVDMVRSCGLRKECCQNELFDKPVSKRKDEIKGRCGMLPKICVRKKMCKVRCGNS